VQGVADLRAARWEKLVWNIPFNGWGAALDMHTGELLRSPAGVGLVRETMREVVCAAQACGVDLSERVIEPLIDTTHEAGDYFTSMQLDRHAGKPMEIQSIIAEPLRAARAAGMRDLPWLSSLLAALLAVEGSRSGSAKATVGA
jgi:2-dehydropantoate 2-reductase